MVIVSSSRGSSLLREVTFKEGRFGIFSIQRHKLAPCSSASSTMPNFLNCVRLSSPCIILCFRLILCCPLAFTNDSFCRFFNPLWCLEPLNNIKRCTFHIVAINQQMEKFLQKCDGLPLGIIEISRSCGVSLVKLNTSGKNYVIALSLN